jgi:type VI secretion system protein ImpL
MASSAPADTAAALPPSPLNPRLRWVMTGVGVAALLVLLWHLGPLLHLPDGFRPFEPAFARIMAGAGVVAVWVWLNLEADGRADKLNARFLEALAAQTDPELDAAANELAAVRGRFDEVLDKLQSARFGRRWGGRTAYQQPWYLVIGAPGSGKSTAVAAAKLGAPFTGDQPVTGIGGTRNCDWWFTDQAVILDTAGRYTTQDSRGAVDGRVWSGLLDLLREHRPRQPLNGVVVTVSLADLSVWTDAERRAHGRLLRQRLAELRQTLGVRLPVYVLCTKADLISGFTAFFDVLDESERAQIWGLSFDVAAPPQQGDDLRDAYLALLRRLDERLLERLHQEPDIQRRNLTFAFPLQMAALEEPLVDLLSVAMGPEPGVETTLLRSVCFVSATQTGVAVDPLLRGPAVQPSAQPSIPAGESAGFFLEKILPETVFPEANLVGLNREIEATRRRRTLAVIGGGAAASLALSAAWAVSLAGNAGLVDDTAAAVQKAQKEITVLDTPPRSLTRVDDTDFALILPTLNALRTLPYGYAARGETPPLTLTVGLYQGARLGGQGDQLYRRALRSVFLSRIVLRLEELLRTSWALPDHLRLGLRAYLMLGGREPLDLAFFAAWMAADWQRSLPGVDNDPRRRALAEHLTALFDVGFAPAPVDDALIQRVNEVLEQSQQRRPPS